MIDDTLTDAVFTPGLTGLQSQDPAVGRGVAITVNPQRDPQIAALFQRREKLDDETFLADWHLDDRHTRVLTDPDTPHALIAYTIQITRPSRSDEPTS